MKACRHVVLMDTSGSFTLAIKLPRQDYRPRPADDRYKEGRQQYHREYNKLQYVKDRKQIRDIVYKLEHPRKLKASKKKWRLANPRL
jgi:hypothetical protein